jgi:hypothetical protein
MRRFGRSSKLKKEAKRVDCLQLCSTDLFENGSIVTWSIQIDWNARQKTTTVYIAGSMLTLMTSCERSVRNKVLDRPHTTSALTHRTAE